MYILPSFQNTNENEALDFIESVNFADVVTCFDGVMLSNKYPLFLNREQKRLFGHVGRRNPQLEHLQAGAANVLLIFSGPGAYVSPQWYASRNMVPTWNFQTLQIRGTVQVLDDSQLPETLQDLTQFHESPFGQAWTLSQLDAAPRQSMLNMLAAFAVDIEDIRFKEKLSQNRSPKDRRRVAEQLSKQGDAGSVAIARLMQKQLERS
ncbi:MAG: FMN-binding negative transcriptional regulator [Gammaproteobacteria bacterium]|nr:FMN-binding negative transcriptional regulator [Gammaproteobacteria bacterium]MDH5799491.1 FMN-binding negative transcriptional regulator [Gammaproteobacteria bacterium]